MVEIVANLTAKEGSCNMIPVPSAKQYLSEANGILTDNASRIIAGMKTQRGNRRLTLDREESNRCKDEMSLQLLDFLLRVKDSNLFFERGRKNGLTGGEALSSFRAGFGRGDHFQKFFGEEIQSLSCEAGQLSARIKYHYLNSSCKVSVYQPRSDMKNATPFRANEKCNNMVFSKRYDTVSISGIPEFHGVEHRTFTNDHSQFTVKKTGGMRIATHRSTTRGRLIAQNIYWNDINGMWTIAKTGKIDILNNELIKTF